MTRVWKIKPHDEAIVRTLERNADVSPVIAQLLAVRGFSDAAQIRSFIEAPLIDLRAAHELPGVSLASEEIWRSIKEREKIVIYGDYDADGMTASAILYRCIKLLGGQVSYFVPNRLDDGYGLNHEALKKLSGQGAQLVVTVDCGIASIDEAKTARALGLKMVITDHHHFGSELPLATAIVHPALPAADYPFVGLCGAGVALKLAWRLCQLSSNSEKVSPAHRSFLLVALGLSAIGTVADVVPLLDENRLIVKHGLAFLKQGTVPGILELMNLTGLHQKSTLSAEDIGFTLAPRLNAAGRLGQAQLGVELLTTDSRQRAESLAAYIHQLNDSRDSLERKVSKAANHEIRENHWQEDPAIVVAQRDWHAGVIGIVAGRIAEKYNRPAVVIAKSDGGEQLAVGSARTACGIHLYEALENCGELLVSWGGHAQAAGLKIANERINDFRDELCKYVSENTSPSDLKPSLDIDAEVPLSHLTLNTVSQLEQLAPFGQGHRRPVFCACGVRLVGEPKKLGDGQRHLSIQIEQESIRMRCIAFGRAEWADQLTDAPLDVAFQPMINEYRGWHNVELRLIDWRPSQVATAVGSAV